MSNHSNASHPSLPSPDLIADPDVRKQFTRLRQESTHHALPILWSADGDTTIRDLAEINHLFIAGAQGQGKSNFIHQILLSLLFTNPRNRMQLLLIDARAMELDRYRPLAASYLVTIPGNEPSTLPGSTASILVALQSLQAEITQRQDWFVQHNCRNMTEYVRWVEKQPYDHTGLVIHFPYLVVVVDELADLDLSHQREIRQLLEHMLFIAAKVGVHFILSTALTPIHPVPSSILSGIEERVIFRLFNRDDYRKLLYTVNFTPPGTKGDFVYLAHGKVAHGKTALIAVAVIDQLVRHLYQPSAPSHSFALPMSSTVAALLPRDRGDRGEHGEHSDFGKHGDRDPLFEEAARLLVQEQIGSTSLIQRRMKLGYNRTASIMAQLEAAGIVGPGTGSKPRDVLIKTNIELNRLIASL